VRSGFAEIEITPPIGTHKIGWLKDIVPDRVVDPLVATASVFGDGDGRIGIVQTDTLSVRWTQVDDIRRRIETACGFPGSNIMVSATHNHAGPAVSATGMVRRDEAYIESLTQKCVEVFLSALEGAQMSEVGFGHTSNFEVGKNRRVVLRDGTVSTHGSFSDPRALHIEGPMDPEVAVLGARTPDGRPIGCILNYACHPTHYGGGLEFSAGYPGVLRAQMKKRGYPVTLFLNGACGNIHTTNPIDGSETSMEDVGRSLASSAEAALDGAVFTDKWRFGAQSETVELTYRDLTDGEIHGTIRGAQRFVDPAIYDALMPRLVERIKNRKVQPAEVQVLQLMQGGAAGAPAIAIAGIPAEYFVEFGLRIKSEAPKDWYALVSSHTNGMVGYVPTVDAFARGGYETTLSLSSRMAPETGDVLAETALRLLSDPPTG
jgi:neutral ceramidase